LELVEYYDKDGTHILLPKIEARVDFHPNPISTPAFVVAKRYAFNNLIGQYDHAIGPMGAHAKLSILYLTSMQDNVFAPTDISGDFDGQYKRGRFAVNRLAPNTNVTRPVSNIPYQAFEGLNRIERDIRNIIRYPIQDDGNSPLNFATGAGLEELQAGMSAEVTEYQKIIRYALQDLDTKRLEWDERVSPDTRKPLAGMRLGVPHTESYTPSKDIKGAYRTMREFGFMSGLDEPGKLVAGGQAMTMKLIDSLSLQEKISGLDDIPRINERKIHDQMRAVLQQGLLAAASQNDPKAMMVAVDSLPEGAEKALYQKWLTPDGDEMSPEEEEMAGAGAPPPSGDITTVLSQLTGSGARSGLQTVSRV
jgi:hypothetical protein